MNKIRILLPTIFSIFIAYSASGLEITTEKIGEGFSDPLYVTSPTGDSARLFVVEQNTARIKIIKNGAVLAIPFLDIGSKAGSGGEQGLLGLAFHPNYSNNGYFYVNYTNNSGNTVIARYRVSGNPDIADPGSETILTILTQPFGNHNGGMLAFSPNDGHLYIGTGDGGSGNDPGNRAQDKGEALGKILRMNVGDGGGFSAPADNPFIGDPGVLDSIWALGLRNPWRFSFDRLNGDLYIADVGQGAREEVNRQAGDSTGGENYGWRCMEGLSCTGLPDCICNSGDLTPPVHDYTHAGGNCSVTGGYAYRGPAIPELDGTYFFADFCTGRIWSFVWEGNNITQFQERTQELQPQAGGAINNVTSFGEDDSGEIYIVDRDGEIFKIIEKIDTPPTPAPTPVPGGDPPLSGFDPNQPGTVNTVTVTNAPRGARVNFVFSTRDGTTSIRSGACSG
ncbi:MAG: PQQ-dependent sugar dehydrogenase, partial [Deltaproteobacteria bacterium]